MNASKAKSASLGKLSKIAIAASFLSVSAAGAPPSAKEGQPAIWFAPASHYPPPKNKDFADAFNQPDGWAQAAKRINVLMISTQTFSAAPVDFVKKITDFANKNKIALAVAGEFQCAGKIKGDPAFATSAVEKIKQAGGTIQYIAMDEPLYQDHYNQDPAACHFSVDDTIKRAADVVSVYTAAFPNVVVGDVEPFPAVSSQADWKQTYTAWQNGFQQASGKKIAFLQLDFNWRDPRTTKDGIDNPDPAAIKNLAKEVAAFAKSRGLPLGMIIDGKSVAKSDAEWLDQAQTNLNFIRGSGILLSQIIYQSWHPHPEKIMPDSDPSTFSGFILRTSGSR